MFSHCSDSISVGFYLQNQYIYIYVCVLRWSAYVWSVRTTSTVQRHMYVSTMSVRTRAVCPACVETMQSAAQDPVLDKLFAHVGLGTQETRIWAVCQYNTALLTTSALPVPNATMGFAFVSVMSLIYCIQCLCSGSVSHGHVISSLKLNFLIP